MGGGFGALAVLWFLFFIGDLLLLFFIGLLFFIVFFEGFSGFLIPIRIYKDYIVKQNHVLETVLWMVCLRGS